MEIHISVLLLVKKASIEICGEHLHFFIKKEEKKTQSFCCSTFSEIDANVKENTSLLSY
jgi:hypothetical protein